MVSPPDEISRAEQIASASSPPVVRVCACSLLSHFVHMTSFVRIALAGVGSFAEVNIVEGDTISRLAERACVKFSHWGVNAGQISLYLVAAGGDEEPAEKAISAVLSSGGRLGVGWSLSRAEISSGAWLVARKIVDGGASFSCLARVSPRTPHSSPNISPPPSCRRIPLWRRRRWRRWRWR